MRLFGLVFAMVIAVAGASNAADSSATGGLSEVLADALADMGMTTADFRIRHDYAMPDVFRLPLVDSLMCDPAGLAGVIDGLAKDIEAEALLAEIAYILWEAMSVEAGPGDTQSKGSVRLEDIAGSFANLPEGLRQPVLTYLRRLGVARALRTEAIRNIESSLDFLQTNCPSLFAPTPEYEAVGPFELYQLEKAEEALTDSVLNLSEAIHVDAVASMSYVAIQAAEDLCVDMVHCPVLPGGSERYPDAKVSFLESEAAVTGTIIYMGLTELGPIVVAGSGRNTYTGCFALILDLGGDDTYEVTSLPEVPFRLTIDVDGDDLHQSQDSPGVAGAIFGTSILIDLRGNDTYKSRSVSMGAGVCGVGILQDRRGDDLYVSDSFSQGAGFIGVGILHDIDGNDTYVAEMQSQAFGYVMGSGVLLDEAGNDTYHTKTARADILRYDDHYLTLSQGCAFGSRPDYSGGIGILIDSRGNDLYSSDIFGQGVAYWFAAGALIDRGGHDRYCSYQYAQGAGIHLAFGLLLDESGDDFYQSKGVSQGCGHDLSLGLLADFSGNDCYTATDLSQGAGNANGIGILYDADGSDSYSSKSMVNVNGYGDYRREFGSIGIHIDSRGRDFYSARGADESQWEGGTYGLGTDIPGEARKPRGDIAVKELPFEQREFTPRELFILSSRGEPRFRAWREYAFERMVADKAASINYLRTVLDTKDARERHTIKDILRDIGEAAVPMLSEAVGDPSERTQLEASWILGLIGSRDGFAALMDLSRANGWKARSNALNSLGKLKDLTVDERSQLRERIGQVLGDPEEVFYVRKDAAFAAGNQALCETVPLLLASLEDEHYSVRFSAAQALCDLSKCDCSGVAGGIAARLDELGPIALVAALRAARDLPISDKLDIAQIAADLPESRTPHVALALARLARTIDPGTAAERARLESITDRIARGHWAVGAILSPERAD